ncbi:MAG: ABC transporter ATP-binding protein [Desulfobacteraceae bacterium]|nr:MAG: ABC transporter ATP-binding protein [Desulfobacteraceae bacterium]
MNRENTDILLSVEDLKVYFHTRDAVAKAVDGVGYQVGRKETVCLVGESGCGKTVSALAVLGLIPQPPGEIAGGRILFDGMNLMEMDDEQMQHIRGNRIAMIFQEPLTSLNPVFPIGEQIAETIRTHKKMSDEQIRLRCIQLLKDVGIPSPEERYGAYPHELSGGQRQRVMIAIALSCEPDLIIADEPTTALDVTVQAQILKLFKSLQAAHGMSVLYITHDLGVVADVAERVYVMYAGVVAEQGQKAHIFKNARHPYAIALLDSLPSRHKRGKRLYSIPGSVPNPAYRPSGCPFHPRCRYAMHKCKVDYPGLCDYGEGHLARCPVLYDEDTKKVEWCR